MACGKYINPNKWWHYEYSTKCRRQGGLATQYVFWYELCSPSLSQVLARRVQQEFMQQAWCKEQWWELVIQGNPVVYSFAPVSGCAQMIQRCNSSLHFYYYFLLGQFTRTVTETPYLQLYKVVVMNLTKLNCIWKQTHYPMIGYSAFFFYLKCIVLTIFEGSQLDSGLFVI